MSQIPQPPVLESHQPRVESKFVKKRIDNYKVCIFEKLRTFPQEKQFFDVTLIAEIDNFKTQAHRIILSATSDYFRTMFSCPLKEANRYVAADGIILKDIDGNTLQTILNFMYSATVELAEENIENLIKAADFFQMQALKDICSEFMIEQLEPGNCLGIASFAKQYSLTHLYKTTTRFIKTNFNKVSKEEEFLQLDATQLAELLSDDNLGVKSEEDIFSSLVAWMQYDEINRENSTQSLLSIIRFTLLSPAFINENAKVLRRRPECDDTICSWLRWHSSSQKDYRHMPRSAATKIAALFESDEHLKLDTYDLKHNIWTSEELPPAPKKIGSIKPIVIDNKLIIVGREYRGEVIKSVQCFDLLTRKWSDLPAPRVTRFDPAMIELDEELYVFGGIENCGEIHSPPEKYNFITGKWYDLAPIKSVNNYNGFQIEKLNGKLYVNTGSDSKIYCYHPSVNEWSNVKLFDNGIDHGEYQDYFEEEYILLSIVAAGKFLYVVGGQDTYETYTERVLRYDPVSGFWLHMAPLLEARSDISCFAFHDRVIACGGRNHDGDYDFIEEYNPKEDQWKTLSPLRAPHADDFLKYFSL